MSFMREAEPCPDGHIATATRQQVLEWVSRSWASITSNSEMIIRAFDVCGISQSLERASQTLGRNENDLRQALDTDSEDGEFLGFTPDDVLLPELDNDCRNPF